MQTQNPTTIVLITAIKLTKVKVAIERIKRVGKAGRTTEVGRVTKKKECTAQKTTTKFKLQLRWSANTR